MTREPRKSLALGNGEGAVGGNSASLGESSPPAPPPSPPPYRLRLFRLHGPRWPPLSGVDVGRLGGPLGAALGVGRLRLFVVGVVSSSRLPQFYITEKEALGPAPPPAPQMARRSPARHGATPCWWGSGAGRGPGSRRTPRPRRPGEGPGRGGRGPDRRTPDPRPRPPGPWSREGTKDRALSLVGRRDWNQFLRNSFRVAGGAKRPFTRGKFLVINHK